MKRKLRHRPVEVPVDRYEAQEYVSKSGLPGKELDVFSEAVSSRPHMEPKENGCPLSDMDLQNFQGHSAQETCHVFEGQTAAVRQAASTRRFGHVGTCTAERKRHISDLDFTKRRNKARTSNVHSTDCMEPSEIKDRYPFGEEGMNEQVEYWSLIERTQEFGVSNDPCPDDSNEMDLDLDDLIYSEWLIYSKPSHGEGDCGLAESGKKSRRRATTESLAKTQSKYKRNWKVRQEDLQSQSQTKTRSKSSTTETVLAEASVTTLGVEGRKESSQDVHNPAGGAVDSEYSTCRSATSAVADKDVRPDKEDTGPASTSDIHVDVISASDTVQCSVQEVVLVGDEDLRITMDPCTTGSISLEGSGSINANRPSHFSAQVDGEGHGCSRTESQGQMEWDCPEDPSRNMKSTEFVHDEHKEEIVVQVPCTYQVNTDQTGGVGDTTHAGQTQIPEQVLELQLPEQVLEPQVPDQVLEPQLPEQVSEQNLAPEAESEAVAEPEQDPSTTIPCVISDATQQDCSGVVEQPCKGPSAQSLRNSHGSVSEQERTVVTGTSHQLTQDTIFLDTDSSESQSPRTKNIKHSSRSRKEETERKSRGSSRFRKDPRVHVVRDHEGSRKRHARYNAVFRADSSRRRYPPFDGRRRYPDFGYYKRSPPFLQSSRYGRTSSGLGGYSPRRRRSDGAAHTPSPPSRSPDKKKSRAWDLHPQAANATQDDVNMQAKLDGPSRGPGSVSPCSTVAATAASCSVLPVVTQQLICPFPPVALIQAPRTLRRLYIGNVPVSVSDGELLEFLNAAMLSANVCSIPGTKPCVNCTVHIEKNYAFAEFVTPEDATAALAFDGIMLHGTVLKLKRPKDYVQPVNGPPPASVPNLISNVVPDSPFKIFLGGISFSLSAQKEKVKEIVTSFGQLKSFHWEVDSHKFPPQVYAFFEYLDPQVTVKACAGLNGLPVANSIWTCVQATEDKSSSKITGRLSYGVPPSAVGLLQAPSRVLELRNLVSEEEFLAMSDTEVSEYVEDIRVECLRFGKIKSIYVIKRPTSDENTVSQKELDAPSSTKRSGEYGRVGSKQEGRHGTERKKGHNSSRRYWGRIYVDYVREDSALHAAPSLHGRTYGGRKAVAGYLPADVNIEILPNVVKFDPPPQVVVA